MNTTSKKQQNKLCRVRLRAWTWNCKS